MFERRPSAWMPESPQPWVSMNRFDPSRNRYGGGVHGIRPDVTTALGHSISIKLLRTTSILTKRACLLDGLTRSGDRWLSAARRE